MTSPPSYDSLGSPEHPYAFGSLVTKKASGNSNGFNENVEKDDEEISLDSLESGSLLQFTTRELILPTCDDDDAALPEQKYLAGVTKHKFGRRASTVEEVAKQEKDIWSNKRQQSSKYVLIPVSRLYQIWWALTVVGAIFTIFYEPYQVAFASPGLSIPFLDDSSFWEGILTFIFAVDIAVNFHLAFFNNKDELVYDKSKIIHRYLHSRKFLIDILAIFPFQFTLLALSGNRGQESTTTQCIALVRLVRLLRSYRVRDLFETLAIDTRYSLISLTLFRNFAATFVWTHIAACALYFIGRQYDLNPEESFLGSELERGMGTMEAYVTSLYWSMVTFATVGYGDFVPMNAAEKVWVIVYIVSNLVIQAWIIGSITLLMIKKDETTGHYRDTLETLDQYSQIHSFDPDFHQRLKNQLQLDFSTREVADEQVLRHFPDSIRRKVLRRLYLPYLINTKLMKGVRPQFVDAFLSTSRVEIFSPGEEIVRRHAVSSDLYLLVGGRIEKLDRVSSSTMATSESSRRSGSSVKAHQSADFLNVIGFFTESPEIETIRTVTVCKTVSISKASYKLLAQDHPGSAGRILQNLLEKVEEMAEGPGQSSRVRLPQKMGSLRAGSRFFDSVPEDSVTGNGTVIAVQELVKMHIEKQKDDQTTRFLFSASRGDTNTIAVMCDQGFNPNSTDYDSRTALMVAAMKGNSETVLKLLECGADPTLVDMHGSSALYEAARNGYTDTMEILVKHGASLCMTEKLAASILDQAVFDGDIVLLRRLLEAKIQVNASDYDKRAAVHIAAAEGNLSALKILMEFGADLSVKDRWGNTAKDEAIRAGSRQLLQFIEEHDYCSKTDV
mmetsp:Transcript_26989/g.41400  ORF Transcript_26989/g.41400 Transcript_26989/m.41400 type:complete len:841 (-) Transcript_26989:19-2541(-)